MLNTILIDAGPIIALFDKDNGYHTKVVSFIKSKKYKFVTTMAVITEVTHMLDFNIEVQILFLEWIMKEGVIIHEVHQQNIARIIELTKKYKDIPMDFADATLVLAAETTGIKKIISIDSNFNIYRLPGKVKIENVFR
jgi:predicted nucleic acid-binding protein